MFLEAASVVERAEPVKINVHAVSDIPSHGAGANPGPECLRERQADLKRCDKLKMRWKDVTVGGIVGGIIYAFRIFTQGLRLNRCRNHYCVEGRSRIKRRRLDKT